MISSNVFAGLLRDWRGRRGFSQLQLAHEADVSQRHISFLELGRSAPSRAMVLRLGAALGMPLRDQNSLLLASGFAPAWQSGERTDAGMVMLDRAIDYMLERHDPYPAFVLDRHWNLLRVNRGGGWFAGYLIEGPPLEPNPANPVNLADAFTADGPMRRIISNWEDTARYFLRTIRADFSANGTTETAALLERLLRYPGAKALYNSVKTDLGADPALTFDTDDGKTKLRVFMTLATLGTPLTVAAQEIRFEYFFPADTETEAVLETMVTAG